ncbi:hypothetical protein ACFQH6_18905 [Halobacteriaceae archaeon GCM10025711]
MDDVREVTAQLLADKPRLTDELPEVLAVDEQHSSWTFDDIPVDSGTFGELVSRGVVEKTGSGYRLADRQAVQAALTGETIEEDTASEGRDFEVGFDFSRPTVERDVAVAFGGVLVLVLVFRMFSIQSVFQNGDIVLLANDPYFYRYWLQRLPRAPEARSHSPRVSRAASR